MKAYVPRTDCVLAITHVTDCDFSLLERLDNEALLREVGKNVDTRLLGFIAKKMGVKERHFARGKLNALDLARSALARLLAQDPSLREKAEFLIFAGISNPFPTTCLSALLACENGMENVSCWDIKSGCSSGILALVQAQGWLATGSKCGIIVCSETLSKFADPALLQMSLATGDGAVALAVEAGQGWKVRGIVHGTDARLFKSLTVPGQYPMSLSDYAAEDYFFKTDGKMDALESLEAHWKGSLQQLLELSGVQGKDVHHYIPHQVDATKNRTYAAACGIPDTAIASNIESYGNMGCPTVFLNYLHWFKQHEAARGDILVLQAVGGGISWAGMCLEKL